MPTGQTCGHCDQPNHNRRTCEAYEKYLKVEADLRRTEKELAEAEAARDENQNIIKMQASRITELKAQLARLQAEYERLKALVGAFAFPSVGTTKGTSAHPDR